MDLAQALSSLRPGSAWYCEGNTYENLEWRDNKTSKPTKQQVEDEILRLKNEYDLSEYQRKRIEEYPSIEEQLDTLYHGGLAEWKASIKAVKDKYPKP